MSKLLPFSKEATQPGRFFSNQITVTGLTGTGTSTVEKHLKVKFGKLPYRFVSVGGIQRTVAEELGMSIEEFAAFNRKHPEKGYDKKCDARIARFAKHNWVIVEGRLPHVFVPRSYHVLLCCDLVVRAERRIKDGVFKGVVEKDSVAEFIEKRDDDDNQRFKLLYPGCLWPEQDYDLVINTSTTEEGDVVERIISNHLLWKQNLPKKKIVTRLTM